MSVISKIKNAIFMLRNDPTSFCSRGIFEINSILSRRKAIKKKINGVLFEFDLSYAPVIRNMLLGKYEIKVRNVMQKILHPGDTFIDVGANIGYFTAIAAGLVGESGEVHSFEPVPKYFQKLKKLSELNPNYKIRVNNYALGEIEGTSLMDVSATADIGLNTMVVGLMKSENREVSIEIPVKRLDVYIKEYQLKSIALIKIDVEGFEFFVLKGLRNFFMNTAVLPYIICEITPTAYSLLGSKLSDLFSYMQQHNYYPFDLTTDRVLDYSYVKQQGLINVLFKHII
jgi:FkbM family methyltransferase